MKASYIKTSNLGAIIAVVLFFCVSLRVFERNGFIGGGFVYMALTLFLFAALVYLGRFLWFSLPLAWLLCLVPTYYYSYHVIPGGFFGHAFNFQMLAVLFIAPSFLLALILAFVKFTVIRFKHRRKTQAPKDV